MDVEVTLGAGKPVRGVWRYKAVEAVGLVALLYGLASSLWWVALAGAGVILVTYSVFRRHYGRMPSAQAGSAGMADDGGGGD